MKSAKLQQVDVTKVRPGKRFPIGTINNRVVNVAKFNGAGTCQACKAQTSYSAKHSAHGIDISVCHNKPSCHQKIIDHIRQRFPTYKVTYLGVED